MFSLRCRGWFALWRAAIVDVFVKVWCDTTLRLGLAIAVVERLRMFDNARLHVLCAKDTLHLGDWQDKQRFLWCDKEKFWITTKAYAEQEAKSDIYVVIDDDHLPIGPDWLSHGCEVLGRNHEYGMLSSWSVNGEVPENGSGEVWPEASIGCPYFIRKGLFGNSLDQASAALPDGPLRNYDTILTQFVMSKGWKTGFLRNVRHNHLGMEHSQVIPEHWTAVA